MQLVQQMTWFDGARELVWIQGRAWVLLGLTPPCDLLHTMDPAVFDSISNLTSLDELLDPEHILKQYDAQAHGAARSLTRQQNGRAADTLARAAANCLRLVLDEQQAAGTDPRPWSMPAQASTVTAVRMVLHIFARFASDWISSLMAANNSSRYQEAHTNVETAVQDSGGTAGILYSERSAAVLPVV